MKISKQNEGEFILFKVDGDIDIYTVSQLKESLRKQIEEVPCNIIIDLAAVTYLDSSGIGLLVNTHKDLVKWGYCLGLVNVNKETRQLFKITYVDKIIDIYSTYDDFKIK